MPHERSQNLGADCSQISCGFTPNSILSHPSLPTGENLEPQPTTGVDWLRREYAKRRTRNTGYSLRAFARDLQIPSGRLSEILSGRRTLTRKMANRFAQKVGLLPGDHEQLMQQIGRHVSAPKPAADLHALREDEFFAIADWEHYAILGLMKTKSFKSGQSY